MGDWEIYLSAWSWSDVNICLIKIFHHSFYSPDFPCYMLYPLVPYNFKLEMQIGDMKGFFGLITVNLQLLRTKLKVLDVTYGNGTGGLGCGAFLPYGSGSFYVSLVFFLLTVSWRYQSMRISIFHTKIEILYIILTCGLQNRHITCLWHELCNWFIHLLNPVLRLSMFL